MYCPNCENEMKNGEKFCGKCGARIPEAQTAEATSTQPKEQPQLRQPDQSQNKTPSKKNKTAIAIIAIVLVIALIVGSVILVLRNKGDDRPEGYDAEYTLNTFCVFSSKNIKDSKECEISVDSDDGEEIGKSYHVTFKLTQEKPNVQLNLVESVYVVSISYENVSAKHKLTTDKSCENNMMTFDVENIKAEPEVTPDGEEALFHANEQLYLSVLEKYRHLQGLYDAYYEIIGPDYRPATDESDSISKEISDYISENKLVSTAMNNQDYWFSEIHYSFVDIDQNGVSELVIGTKTLLFPESSVGIEVIYTQKDGEFYELISGGMSLFLEIYSGGYIEFGTTSPSKAFYVISPDDPTTLEKKYEFTYDAYGLENEKFYNFDKEVAKDEYYSVIEKITGSTDRENRKNTVELNWHSINEIENSEATAKQATTEPTTTKPSTTTADLTKTLFSKLEGNSFVFSSGVGGWGTELKIKPDGSFSGEYHDWDAVSDDENAPNGNLAKCTFNGKFSNLKKVNDYTYSRDISHIEYENEPGTSEIIDGMKYEYTTPYGMEGSGPVLIYTPDAPVSELPEQFLSWACHLKGSSDLDGKLGFYGLFNTSQKFDADFGDGAGFAGFDEG